MGKPVGAGKAQSGGRVRCTDCGTENPPGARFCRSCGSPVDQPATGSTQPGPRRLSPAVVALGMVALVALSASAVVALSSGGTDEDQTAAEARPATDGSDNQSGDSAEADSVATDADRDLDLVLDDEGLGDLTFGAPAEATVTALTEAIGPPDTDTGENPDNYCPGGDLFRAVRWGPLVVLINFGSITSTPARVDPYFWGWSYARFAGYTGERLDDIADTLGLTSPSGIGLDSSGADIEERASNWEFYEGEPFGFPPPSYSADDLYIVVDANGPQARVTSLNAGGACGE